MSFQKYFIITFAATFYFFVSYCFSAQEAKLVKVSEWGSNYVSSALAIDNKYLFFEYGSHLIDVYDPSLTGTSAYINKIKFQKPLIGTPYLFQGKLVTLHRTPGLSFTSLNIYSIENLLAPMLQYSIDIGSDGANTINPDDNKLAHINDDGEIFVLEAQEDSYVVISASNSQFKSEYGTGYNIRLQALGFDGDILYLATLKDYTEGTSNKELSVEKFELSEGEYKLVSTINAQGLVNSASQLIYLEKGMFAVNNYNGDGIYIFAEKNMKLSLIHSINDINAFSGTMTYGNDQLWVTYPNHTMRSYKVDLFDLEIINDISLATIYTELLDTSSLQIIGDDLLVVGSSGLIKINIEQSKYVSNESLFHTGAPINGFAYKNKRLYVPSPGNINVLNIENPIAPILEAQVPINSSSLYTVKNLYVTGDNISYLQSGRSYNGFLSYRLENNIPILDADLTTQQPYFSDFRRLVSGNSLFIGIDENKIARFDLTSKNSIAESPYYTESIALECGYCYPFKPVAVSGNFLYVKDYTAKTLHIYNNPFEEIEYVGKHVFESNIYTVKEHNGYIILGESSNKIKILLPLENGMLKVVSQISGLDYRPYIKIFGDYIITMNNSGYLQELYDISEPENPKLVYSTGLLEDKLLWDDDNDQVINDYLYTQTSLGLISIFKINHRPVFTKTDYVIDEDTTLEVNLSGLDPEQDVMSVEIVQEPLNGLVFFDADNQRYSYLPNSDFVGEDSTKLKLLDLHGNYDESTISILVNAINDPPIANDLNFELDQNTSIEESLSIVDPDDDTFIINVIQEPDSGTLNVNLQGSFYYQPNVGFYGKDSFSLTVQDSSSAEVTILVNLSISQVNNPPIAEDVNVELVEGNDYSSTLPKEDAEGDKLNYSLKDNAENGTVTITAEGEYTYTPNTSFFGEDKFTYEVTDTFNDVVIGVVYLTIEAKPAVEPSANVAPTVKSDSSGGSINAYMVLFLLLILLLNRYYFQYSRIK
jgi:hypothetical protein